MDKKTIKDLLEILSSIIQLATAVIVLKSTTKLEVQETQEEIILLVSYPLTLYHNLERSKHYE